MKVTEYLDAVEARANAATEGPWEHDPDSEFVQRPLRPATSMVRFEPPDRLFEVWGSEDDADFAAHARQDVPTLVAALRGVLDQVDHALAAADETEGQTAREARFSVAYAVRHRIEAALGGAS